MVEKAGEYERTMEFRLVDDGRPQPIPDARTHPRLRGFVDAMDRMRRSPEPDDGFVFDRPIESRRPIRRLGRLVIAKAPVAPSSPDTRNCTQGARATASGLHHVALMRAPEIVVRYLHGDPPAMRRFGYSGVFCSDIGLDEAFKASEPPAHDDWVPRAIADADQRSVVNVALTRIKEVCREVAGYGARQAQQAPTAEIPLGHFADAMAALLPSIDGIGARRRATPAPRARAIRQRAASIDRSSGLPEGWMPPASSAGSGRWSDVDSDRSDPGDWVQAPGQAPAPRAGDRFAHPTAAGSARPTRRPEMREAGQPEPVLRDGQAVLQYPFDLRTHGHHVKLSARIEVMTTDGRQVEDEPPYGEPDPEIYGWVDPAGVLHRLPSVDTRPETADGDWAVLVSITTEAVMRVDIEVTSR
jgi:hypothetical protein